VVITTCRIWNIVFLWWFSVGQKHTSLNEVWFLLVVARKNYLCAAGIKRASSLSLCVGICICVLMWILWYALLKMGESVEFIYFMWLFPLKNVASLLVCSSLQASRGTKITQEVDITSRQPPSRSWWHHKYTRVSSIQHLQPHVCWWIIL